MSKAPPSSPLRAWRGRTRLCASQPPPFSDGQLTPFDSSRPPCIASPPPSIATTPHTPHAGARLRQSYATSQLSPIAYNLLHHTPRLSPPPLCFSVSPAPRRPLGQLRVSLLLVDSPHTLLRNAAHRPASSRPSSSVAVQPCCLRLLRVATPFSSRTPAPALVASPPPPCHTYTRPLLLVLPSPRLRRTSLTPRPPFPTRTPPQLRGVPARKSGRVRERDRRRGHTQTHRRTEASVIAQQRATLRVHIRGRRSWNGT